MRIFGRCRVCKEWRALERDRDGTILPCALCRREAEGTCATEDE